jgi:iron complex transport system ATP-binding protein
MEPVLSLTNVGFRYARTWVLKGVDLEVQAGDLLGILGPNGSGKSTLLKVADGVLSPGQGEVRLHGRSVTDYSRTALSRAVAMVGQENHFRFSFSALEVVLMGRFPHMGRFQFEGKRDMDVAMNAMAATDCLSLADRSIHELSGGEKQRVLMARALTQEPAVILLDEPTSFLDLRYKKEIFDLIGALTRDRGLSVLVVTHDMDLAAVHCDRLVLLKEGRVHASGAPDAVVTAEHVEAVYGCPVRIDQNPATKSPRVTLL